MAGVVVVDGQTRVVDSDGRVVEFVSNDANIVSMLSQILEEQKRTNAMLAFMLEMDDDDHMSDE